MRFGLVYYPEFNEMVGAGEFISVYDKKLLWRANAYIDETKNEDGTASGNTDWNNVNKWTATNGNTWDAAGDGGQCVIQPWTRPYDPDNLQYFRQSQTSVFNAVAYSGGCSDTVMHFNQDLNLQAEALTANGEPANRNNKTLAPALDWDNYITGDYVAESNPALWTAPTIGGSIRYPHRPVLTSVTGKNYNGTVLGYTTTQLGYSAGIDCYGHIQRIASYNGNQYRLRDFSVTDNQGDGDRLEWEQDNSTRFESLTGIREDSWLIEGITTTNINNQTGPRNNIIPGDIITMDGHVAVISKVGFFEGTRIINPDIVIFIECTSPQGEWKVLSNTNRHLKSISAWANNLELRRLSIQ